MKNTYNVNISSAITGLGRKDRMHNFNSNVSGVIKAASGQIYHIQVGKVSTGAGVITIYDNPSAAAGNIIWSGDGAASQDFDMTNGSGTGSPGATGLYLQLGGTTNASVNISYD